MELITVTLVHVQADAINSFDYCRSLTGELNASAVRRVSLSCELDPSGFDVCLPFDVIAQLDLTPLQPVRVGGLMVRRFGGLDLNIMGRQTCFCPIELPAGATPVLGRVILDALDLKIDPATGLLCGVHGDVWIVDQLLAS